jgi:DivIVA domain-containing protein
VVVLKRGTIDRVTVVWVVVIVALVGAVVVVAVGRGAPMSEVYDDRPDATVPAGRPLTSDDLRDVRFSTAVRGYRMDEVDALLARVRADLIARESAAASDGEPPVVEKPLTGGAAHTHSAADLAAADLAAAGTAAPPRRADDPPAAPARHLPTSGRRAGDPGAAASADGEDL